MSDNKQFELLILLKIKNVPSIIKKTRPYFIALSFLFCLS